MWIESSCKLCKFGKYICYNFRDIKFFLGGYFFWRALYKHKPDKKYPKIRCKHRAYFL